MMIENIKLVKSKKECCGCSACMNICPKNAISMKTDEYGFTYPKIDNKKCIKCGLCKRTCAYQNERKTYNIPQKIYAATTENEDILLKSTSGGISGEICSKFINDNGIVYGCSIEKDDKNVIIPMHIRIDNKNELEKIQGSKYVKSQINFIYRNVRNDLLNDKKVLFTGTPCQIDALYSYLEMNDTDIKNLYTIDLICHGVPDTNIFQDYIKFIENKIYGKVQNFKFRDKKVGGGWDLRR